MLHETVHQVRCTFTKLMLGAGHTDGLSVSLEYKDGVSEMTVLCERELFNIVANLRHPMVNDSIS